VSEKLWEGLTVWAGLLSRQAEACGTSVTIANARHSVDEKDLQIYALADSGEEHYAINAQERDPVR
jgi:hypothetical protein